MVQFHIGCAGWAYPDWKTADFYPKKLSTNSFLSFYQKYFNFTEINTSFYHIPSKTTLLKWNEETSTGFSFSAKVWKKITHHYSNYNELEIHMKDFFTAFSVLESKIDMFLFQFPASFHKNTANLNKLKFLIQNIPDWSNSAIEFRHSSWFESSTTMDLFHPSNISLATSFFPGLTPYVVNEQKIQYIRMIGDRKITKFNQTQRLQKSSFDDLIGNIQQMQQSPTIEDIFVIFNNHYRGFAPQDITDLKKALHLKYKPIKQNRSLLDFI